ncbi:alanine racemase [Herbiconiux sp. A18JL235]|uniref:Alanine racemase n=1 Tax=Herbiconiux sp. A18JL235 TaxID=3152363 RepID=A0AB39BGP8_9MICO
MPDHPTQATRVSQLLEATGSHPTPLLVVREQTLRSNIDRMQSLAEARGVRLRPHLKTHKSTFVAGLQRDRGASAVTVATLGEAEVFAAAGHRDILAAFAPVDHAKSARYERLATAARLTFCVDHVEGVARVAELARTTGVEIGFYWELDTGSSRSGTHPDRTWDAVRAAIESHPAARFAGLMSFGGHLYAAESPDAAAAAARRDARTIGAVFELATTDGFTPPAVSVGATPAADALISDQRVTELRAGNYVYNDATQVALGSVSESECALFVVGTVTGRPAPGRALIDAGSKAIPKEIMSSLTTGFGIVVGHPELVITRLYEEVGVIEGPASAIDALGVGERVAVIPNHSCSASVLYPEFVLVAQDGTTRAVAIDARDH